MSLSRYHRGGADKNGGKSAVFKMIGDTVITPFITATIDSYKDEIKSAIVGNALAIVEDLVRTTLGTYISTISSLKMDSSPDAALDSLKKSLTSQIFGIIDSIIPPSPPRVAKPGEVVIDIQINPIVKNLVSTWIEKLFKKMGEIIKNKTGDITSIQKTIEDKSVQFLNMKPKELVAASLAAKPAVVAK